MLCNDCSQSTPICDISRLGLRLMQHNSWIYLTGDWGVHVGSDIGMFTFWYEHIKCNQNPSNSKPDDAETSWWVLLFTFPPFLIFGTFFKQLKRTQTHSQPFTIHPSKKIQVRAIGGVPKMVVPNNHGFPTINDHFGVFWGYHHLRKHPYV